MHSLMEHTLFSNKPNNAVKTVQIKQLTINLEQRQANSNLKGSKPHKAATKPD